VRADVVIVGSGINSLVCAAVLARTGKRVVVLERNDRLGGCIRSEELFPGFTHDVLSGWYPLFVASPAYQMLGDDLARHGLEFINTQKPTAVVTTRGEHLVFTTDIVESAQRLDALADGDGKRFAAAMGQFLSRDADFTFGALGQEPWSSKSVGLLTKEFRKRGLSDTVSFLGEALESCRAWLERDFQSELTRALIAPWVLHAGLGPDDAYSGVMGKVIMAALGLAGLPVVKGGSERIVSSFQALIEEQGGVFMTDTDVVAVTVENGRATGVVTGAGDRFEASSAVVANVTPTQLYGRLLDSGVVPAEVRSKAESYRYGRADMQIHFALDSRPRWAVSELAEVPLVHLTPGLDGVSKAVNEALRGLLPDRATVVVGQPTALDSSRAPHGKWILWIQLQELPSRIKGDARGEIATPDDGLWTTTVAEQYADRIQARLAQHIDGLSDDIVGRRVFSPADLENLNMNLVGGDPYSGACTIDQFLLWRPFGPSKQHRTPVRDLYHIGASTHPGPGLGGNSGFLVGSHLR
jgi:phytoene dehydrogenase-like protein